MSISDREIAGPDIFRLDGDLDVSNAGTVGDQLCALVTDGRAALVVSGASVTFVESRGLAMMARVQRLADESGCDLRWRDFPLSVLRTLHVSGLDTYLRIEA
jgi:anti-anti-sigma factor